MKAEELQKIADTLTINEKMMLLALLIFDLEKEIAANLEIVKNSLERVEELRNQLWGFVKSGK